MVGTAGWLTIGVGGLELAGRGLSVPEIAAGTVVAAGASMLPDLDHPQATASRSLGPVTGVLSKALNTAAGGHRQGTHSLLFALLVGVGAAWLLANTSGPWVALAMCFFFASLALRVLTEASGLISAGLAALVAATLISFAPEADWLWLSISIGCLLHMLGDILTPEGVPPLWPVSGWRLRFPIIGHTGDWRESVIAGACGVLTLILLATTVFLPLWQNQPTTVEAKAPTGHDRPENRGPRAIDY
jgi:membrane-bound metal-dependent hydrolase YbcI (DUF457 family)